VPNTLIATRSGWITDPAAVIDAVQSALRETLKIPEGDRTLRLIEHPASPLCRPALIESPPENWGLRGGMPASEIDLGFKIDV